MVLSNMVFFCIMHLLDVSVFVFWVAGLLWPSGPHSKLGLLWAHFFGRNGPFGRFGSLISKHGFP